MKKIFSLLIVICFFSCDKDDNYEYYNVATPIIMSKAEFRNSVDVVSPQNIEEEGKIYAYGDYIFINDEYRGVHVIDNTDPVTPNPIAFIKIPGNKDISIKDNYLYADSAVDLVVIDISNINNIDIVNRLEDVFQIYDYQVPLETEIVEFGDYNYETDIIIGWEVTVEKRESLAQDDVFLEAGGFDTANVSSVGVGGSLARFQIVDEYLYTVGTSEMSIFNISNLSNPLLTNTMYAGWSIETMFYAQEYLYLGGSNGMYIYSIQDRSNPSYVSEFTHWEGCDPVVVDGDYAYLTLRGGNLCGQDESVLEVIDISDKYNPTLVGQYTMENPYGLGYRTNSLFVCDGTAGLKIFDKSNPLALELTNHFETVNGKDVIPLENILLMVGDNMLYQYQYTQEGISLLSQLQL